MRYIQRRVLSVTLPTTNADGSKMKMEQDTLDKLYQAIILPAGEFTATQAAISKDLINKLDPKYTGEVTEIAVGEWLELSEPEHMYVVGQLDGLAKAGSLLFGTFDRHPLVQQVYREWRDSQTDPPLTLEAPKNGKAVTADVAEAVPA